MEDNFTIYNDNNFSLFGIFDGHAGSNTSYLASEMMLTEVKSLIRTKNEQKFSDCFEHIQNEVKSQNLIDGCTAAVTFVYDNICYIGSIGDSRILRIKKNGFEQITKDQKATIKHEYNRLKRLLLGVIDGRVKRKLALSRAIGDLWCGDGLFIKPKVKSYQIDDEEIGLIVACDGVWDVLTNEEAYKIFVNAKSPQDAATSLKNAAIANGSMDNVSVIVVFFHPEAKYSGVCYCNEIEKLPLVPEIESNDDEPFHTNRSATIGVATLQRRRRR
ncbi:protein phosphatase 2C [Histomonas meleagridis]|uniref:protein phosphatase 2C n=1 Tax=Histomonas meleagridis TaxID=135588 RepID=UPI0035598654|nr:protein phosphatase 2C [Histomonas meleagridis]KAH0796466.1 protein phosphatase 2C [Histomonas meleagridis]